MTNSEAYTILDGLRSELAAALLGLNEDPRLKEVTEAQIEALGCACEALSVPEVQDVPWYVKVLGINDDPIGISTDGTQYIYTGTAPMSMVDNVNIDPRFIGNNTAGDDDIPLF